MSLDVHPQLLRTLRAVIETGSFTGASERLGFTQSAVSKQVAALESAAGVQLFRRGSRGVEPTAAGLRLAGRAAAVIDQLDAARRELDAVPAPVGGRVALGGFPTTAMVLVPRALARLRAEHPSVQVDYVESSTPVQLRRLRAGRLDLAVVAAGEGLPDWDLTGVETEELPSAPLMVAVAAGHRFARAGRVEVAELADEVWIAGRDVRGEPQFGAWPTLPRPVIGAELSEWSSRFGYVAAGLGITTVPGLAVDALPAGVVAVAVEDPRWRGRGMLLAHVGRLDPAASLVRDVLHQVSGAIATAARGK